VGALWGATALVLALGLGVELAHYVGTPQGLTPRVLELFSLSAESNVPTWWTSVLAGACALALGGVARARRESTKRHAGAFTILAVGFALISLDEVAQLHENLGLLFEGEGAFYFGWVKVAIPLVLVLGLAFVPLLRALPSGLAARFVVAGALYVSGAVLMELPLGLWTEAHGTDNLGYSLIDWVEESLEIGALTFFLSTLRARRPALVAMEG
jgi:hypothetical protein